MLDDYTGHSLQIEPINDYAATDRYEAFAEGFVSYLSTEPLISPHEWNLFDHVLSD